MGVNSRGERKKWVYDVEKTLLCREKAEDFLSLDFNSYIFIILPQEMLEE
jgi:hypothetical protein